MPSGRKVFLKEFFVLALPIMLQQLSGTILNICDTIMVGKISDKAISAVTVANKTYLIYALFIYGISSGIMMFMSQYNSNICYCNCTFSNFFYTYLCERKRDIRFRYPVY
jgi:Na+-driven multidrug efflux pump